MAQVAAVAAVLVAVPDEQLASLRMGYEVYGVAVTKARIV